MNNSMTFEEMWENIKSKDENTRESLEVAERVGAIINSITNARISQGVSQRELADRCGVKQSAIARMERLQVMPRLDTVVKVANSLGLCISAEKVYSTVEAVESVSVEMAVPTITSEKMLDDKGHFQYRTWSRKLAMAAMI